MQQTTVVSDVETMKEDDVASLMINLVFKYLFKYFE